MIKIGLVGLGGMGTVHYNNYKQMNDCEVTAAVGTTSADEKKAQEFGLKMYRSVSDMIRYTDLDVVDICTPTFLHYEQIKEALTFDKNVITEKPMTLHSVQAKELFDLAKTKNRHVYVGQVTRFAKDNEVLQKLVKDNQYGKIKDAYFCRLSVAPAWSAGNWMFDKEKSGQLPFDLHIHDLDTIIHLFGKPQDYCYTSVNNENAAYKEHYRFLYKYPDFNVCAEAAWYHAKFPFKAAWRVYFENAVVVNNGESVIAYPYNEEPYHYNIEEKTKIATGINVPPTEMYFNELRHYIDCVKENTDSDILPEQQVIDVISILEKVSFGETIH